LWVIVGKSYPEASRGGSYDESGSSRPANKQTDDRGRIYLGTEYANKRVTVAVVEVESDRPDDDELAAAYREASESSEALAEEWSETSDEALKLSLTLD
jgi:hypothetical protein